MKICNSLQAKDLCKTVLAPEVMPGAADATTSCHHNDGASGSAAHLLSREAMVRPAARILRR